MSKFERMFGKFAIPNLTFLMIMGYAVGYIIERVNINFMHLLTLDPQQIMHGQVWRLFTWLIAPPSDENNLFFILILLLFTYSIGTAMERTLGTYRYNVFIWTGVFLTIVASFVCWGFVELVYQDNELNGFFWATFMSSGADLLFNTYYISLSVFLAYAVFYPDAQVLLMLIIPVKVKWIGWLDAGLMIYLMIFSTIFDRFIIGAALLNFLIFYLRIRRTPKVNIKQVKRKVVYKAQVATNSPIKKHKCAICGQSDQDNPDLEFRFCSKCNGNYEYCQNHLFTHEHVK